MLKKSYIEKQGICVVTFNVRFDGASKVELVGEWNGWTPEVMNKKRDGSFWLMKRLRSGREYRFKYLIDGNAWENDPYADGYVPNPFGTTDSLVRC
ncbi:MAG: isoamylase early set domain-containing protein [Hydrogenobacter sp.]|uniref:isoamylase early set domain-containing protein n=1 Tax=Hydrogenobacter thermophilus TaxID=940 RepID=UPI0030FA0842